MTWISLEDDFHSNPKVIAAGLAGAGAYARALSYCGAYLTDGILPQAWIRSMYPPKIVRKLIEVGLLVEQENGDYAIPHFLDFNPSRAEVLKRREEKARAGRAGARKRWAGHGTSDGTSDGSSHDQNMAQPMVRARDAPTPISEGGHIETSSEINAGAQARIRRACRNWLESPAFDRDTMGREHAAEEFLRIERRLHVDLDPHDRTELLALAAERHEQAAAGEEPE